ncbi:MAG: LysM peptidoglycan-binding domain-containing protein [Burkholderiaceae bacterium]|nr:LysM peptidoglycan-binding domain-containing protein [Burkholderiaceae bacterium]
MLKVQKNTTSGWVVVGTQRKHLIASLIFSLLATSAAQNVAAAGLGRLTVFSSLGQPLRAEVDITSLNKEEEASLSVRLASAEAFRNANIDASPVLSSVRFTIDTAPSGRKVVRITSSLPVSEPFLDLLLELNWNTGKLVREYTVLLDPAGTKLPPVETSAPTVTLPSSASPPPSPALVRPQAASGKTVTAKPAAKSASSEAPPPSAVGDYTVKTGDSLGKIARQTAPAGVNLDQMLVSLYRANPEAFISRNMNRLKAGVVLKIPDAASVSAVTPAEARKEVIAQSSNFSAYRQRVAGVATKTSTSNVDASLPKTQASGTVTARIDDNAKKSTAQDQVKVAKADSTATGSSQSAKSASTAKQAEVEKAANAKAAKEAAERAAALEKNLADMKALQLKNQQLAQQQAAADVKKTAADKAAADKAAVAKATADKAAADKAAADKAAADKAAVAKTAADKAAADKAAVAKAAADKAAADKAAADKAAADKAAADKAAADKAAADKAAADKAAADKAAADKAAADKAAADKAAADKAATDKAATDKAATDKAATDKAVADKKATETPPPPAPAKAAVTPKVTPPPASSTESLLDNLTSPYVLGGLALVLLASGYGIYRIRRKRDFEGFGDSVASTGNSVVSTSGGQSVDTNNASVFNSNYLPLSNQMVSNEVDPVAEADVYIAYGRDKQAEEILRAAIVAQPERHNARLKLLEIYAGRKDLSSFEKEAKELHERTGGLGEDWKRAATLGAALDPGNQLYSVGAAMAAVNAPAAMPSPLASPAPVKPSNVSPAGGASSSAVDPSATLSTPLQAGAESLQQTVKVAVPSNTAQVQAEPPQPSLEEAAYTLPAPMAALLDPPKAGEGEAALDLDLGISSLEDGRTMLMPEAVAAGDPSSAFLQPERSAKGAEKTSQDLGISLDINKSASKPPISATSSQASDALDFDLGQAPAAAPPPLSSSGATIKAVPSVSSPANVESVANETALDFDLSGFDIPKPVAKEKPSVTITAAAAPASADSEMGTKLSLASAYIAIGDNDGARELLSEVLALGNAEQKASANELLARIA